MFILSCTIKQQSIKIPENISKVSVKAKSNKLNQQTKQIDFFIFYL